MRVILPAKHANKELALRRISALAVVGGLLICWLPMLGCGGGQTIQLRYDRQPEYDIPTTIRRLGIAEFGGRTSQDKQWGDIASDRLAAALDAYNRKFNRYELVDRKRLRAILDEQDLQLAMTDAASVGRVGKIANVHAMIYGNVKVTTRDQRATRMGFDPLRRTTKTIHYTRRYCLAVVNFTMDDITTGKTLAAVPATRDYDSEKDKKASKSISKALGFGGSQAPPADQVVSHLIDECVADFLSKISPHEVVVTEKLQRGASEVVRTGNKLAAAGEYAEALECYQSAIELNGADHGALFNAGLMHEALGKLTEAERFYDRACGIKPKENYIFARKRVRSEKDR